MPVLSLGHPCDTITLSFHMLYHMKLCTLVCHFLSVSLLLGYMQVFKSGLEHAFLSVF